MVGVILNDDFHRPALGTMLTWDHALDGFADVVSEISVEWMLVGSAASAVHGVALTRPTTSTSRSGGPPM